MTTWQRFFFVVSLVGLIASTPSMAAVTARTSKSASSTSIMSDPGTVCVTVGVPGPAGEGGPAPATKPTFTLDLYDADVIANDAVGIDESQPPPACSGWTRSRVVSMTCGSTAHWRCCWSIPALSNSATDATGPPDPTLEVVITGPGSRGATGNTLVVSAPDSAPISLLSVDLGIDGPSHIANSDVLFGAGIAAFSRGYDEISTLGTTSALFFVSDPSTQALTSSVPLNEGQVFVLNPSGELWPEQAYGVGTEPGDFVGTVGFLNVNTAAGGAPTATTEMFVVFEGSSQIEFTPDSDLGNLSSYLDLGAVGAVTGLAVEDQGARGVWDSGDRILYAVAGSPAIRLLEFGGSASFLDVNGVVFDGTTSIVMSYLGDGAPDPSLTVGHVTALSVGGTNTVDPPDRFTVDVTDYTVCTEPVPSAVFPMSLVFVAMIAGLGLYTIRSA